jgi:cytochrome P450
MLRVYANGEFESVCIIIIYALLGQKFAMLEQKSLLSTMMRNFTFRTIDPKKSAEYSPDLTLRPKNGVDLMVTLRK